MLFKSYLICNFLLITPKTFSTGVVDSVSETSTSISYMKQTDQVGCSWAFPEDAEVRQTAYEQILERDVKVEYRCTSIIRCYIPLAIAEALTEEMLALQIRV